MPPPRLPYLMRETTRHGRVVWYFRRYKTERIRIPGEYGEKQFLAAYWEAATGKAPAQTPQLPRGTVAWLIARYQESGAWSQLSLATQRQRSNILKHVVIAIGEEEFCDIDRAAIVDSRDKRRATPAQANIFLKCLRGLFRWAIEAGHAEVDPTHGVKMLTDRTDGYHTWTDEEVGAYETQWPVGTRERVWLDVLLYTGLRRGDAARLGPSHVRNGVFSIVTEKSHVQVIAPILPRLAETLAAGPVGAKTYIVGARGESLVKESFGNLFRAACLEAGVPGSAHGLRKAGATRAAEAGATPAQLRAMFGWSNDKMPSLYTRAADRTRMAAEAMPMLETVRGTKPKRKTFQPQED